VAAFLYGRQVMVDTRWIIATVTVTLTVYTPYPWVLLTPLVVNRGT